MSAVHSRWTDRRHLLDLGVLLAGLLLFAVRQTVPLILLLGLFVAMGAWHHGGRRVLRRTATAVSLAIAYFVLLAWEGALGGEDYLAISLVLVIVPIMAVGADGHRWLRVEVLKLQQTLAERGLELVKASKESDRLASLNKIYQTITPTLEIEEVFGAFAAEVKTLIDYDRLVVELFEQAGPQLEMVALTASSDGVSTKTVRTPLLHSASGWVAVNQQPLVSGDLNDEGGFPLDRESIDTGLRSEIIVPLTGTGGIMGTIGLSSREKDKYSARDVEMVEQIGSQVAMSVGNARLYQRSREMAMVEERNRLAREIHDSIAQQLIALILQLEAARTLLPKNAGEALAELRQAGDLARLSLEEARRSVWDLRPPPLESLSLSQAIAQELNAVARQAGFSAYFAVRGEEKPLTSGQEAALFRIAQEAIRNSQKHGAARRVEGTLEFTEDEVVLMIQDEGVGFDVEHALAVAPGQGGGYGLTSMQERTAMLGGQLRIESSLGGGTSVWARIPYSGPSGKRATPATFDRSTTAAIGVLIVDADPMARESIRLALESAGIRVVGEAAEGREAVHKAHDLRPDVVLIDLQMPDISGTAVIEQVREDSSHAEFLILTAGDRGEHLLQGIRAGAKGYVPKDSPINDLVGAIKAIYQGELHSPPGARLSTSTERLAGREDVRDELTPREREVLQLIATGARNREIGHRLSISEKTVKFHIANIFQKLGVESRTEAMSRALERGLWEP